MSKYLMMAIAAMLLLPTMAFAQATGADATATTSLGARGLWLAGACIGAGLACGVMVELLAKRFGWKPAVAATAAVFVLVLVLLNSDVPAAFVVVAVLALTSSQYVVRPLLSRRF